MSDAADKPNGRIVSIADARKPHRKASDWATRQDVADMIAAECAKVHEYYLNQIPPFCARMIQDALISFGLLQVAPGPAHPDGAQNQAVPAMPIAPGDEPPIEGFVEQETAPA